MWSVLPLCIKTVLKLKVLPVLTSESQSLCWKAVQVGVSSNRHSVSNYPRVCTVTYLYKYVRLYKKWIKISNRRWLTCHIIHYLWLKFTVCVAVCIPVAVWLRSIYSQQRVWCFLNKIFEVNTSLSLVFCILNEDVIWGWTMWDFPICKWVQYSWLWDWLV